MFVYGLWLQLVINRLPVTGIEVCFTMVLAFPIGILSSTSESSMLPTNVHRFKWNDLSHPQLFDLSLEPAPSPIPTKELGI